MAISAEQLNIILSARDKEFTKAMERSQRRVEMFAKKSQKELSKTGKAFEGLSASVKKFAGPAAIGAAITGMSRGVDNATRFAVEIDNLARISGVGVERFQELAYASKRVGIEQDKLSDILKDVNDKFGDYLSTGAGPLADFFENIAPKVNLTKEAFAGLSSEQALGKYVKALQDAGLNQQQMTFYMEALASDATALTPLFYDNAGALTELAKQARAAGTVLDQDLIQKSVEMRRNWDAVVDAMAAKFNSFYLGVGSGIANLFALTPEIQIGELEQTKSELEQKRAEVSKKIADVVGDKGADDLTFMDQAFIAKYRMQIDNIAGEISAVKFAMQQLQKQTEDVITLPEIEVFGEADDNGVVGPVKDIEDVEFALDSLGDAMDDLDSIAATLENGLEDVFMSALDGADSFKDTMRSTAAAVIKELYRVLVVQKLVNAAMGFFGAPVSGSPVPVTNNASGGTLQAGTPSIVGENGPELIVPSKGSRILSHAQTMNALSGGGSGVTVVQNINVSTGVQQTVRTEIKSLMPQIAESAKAAVADAKRRGGSYGRAFS